MSSPFRILHPAGFAIGKDADVDGLASIEGSTYLETTAESGVYRIPCFEVHDESIVCSVYVSRGRVTQVAVALDDDESYGSTWTDATEEKERKRADDTAQWLAGLGFAVGEYSWGSIWAGFDAKGFSGGGLVTYLC